MRPKSAKLLWDIQTAGRFIVTKTFDMDYDTYVGDLTTMYAVERAFEIIGEALSRLRRGDPELFERIPSGDQIIGFRNVLAHGYDTRDTEIVWTIIESRLPPMLAHVVELLGDEPEPVVVD